MRISTRFGVLLLAASLGGCIDDPADPGADADALPTDEQAVTGAFVHPGVLVSKAQLDLVRSNIAANKEPWKTQFTELEASKYARSTWVPHPIANIECGPSNVPEVGCDDEMDDAHAALTTALLWYYTGHTAYADKAIQIMNAYSATVQEHTYSNAPLQAAWASANFTRAAEIIRHTSTRWSSTDIARFQSLLTTKYLPLVKNGWVWGNGNWDLSMIDATVSIAIFSDDRTTFNAAVAKWKLRVPAYIYLTSDGTLPVRPSGTSDYASEAAILGLWIWPTTGSGSTAKPKYPFVDGVAQETCRDANHVSLALTSMLDTAESAHIQGIDLYSYSNFATRITKGLEFQSKYLDGTAIPTSICGGETAHRAAFGFYGQQPYTQALNFEVGYNHYANRLGMSLPQTKASLVTIDGNHSSYRNKVGPTVTSENLSNAEK